MGRILPQADRRPGGAGTIRFPAMARSPASTATAPDGSPATASAPPPGTADGVADAAPECGCAMDRQRMGVRLRSIRKAQGFTLKALSGRSGVALSTLSKMELGQISISYEKFAAVAQALEVDIVRLLDPAAPATPPVRAPVFVHVRSIGPAPGRADGPYDYRMLAADFPGRRMEPMRGRVLARAPGDVPDFVRHAGQAFVTVLSGTVRICFETGEAVRLRRGESLYFNSGVGHRYLSVGRTDAEIVAVRTAGP